jgi:demethylmenaquinone methyltransferase / 2-methoxy-6-polyprenyl-1,4-benzoquinol methylase
MPIAPMRLYTNGAASLRGGDGGDGGKGGWIGSRRGGGASTLPPMPDVTDANPAAVAPHPPIPGFYDRPEEKRPFVRRVFDDAAGDYDRVERMMALGSGPWYRRRALVRAGLRAGMRVLDVAAGTGLVTREAVAVAGDAGLVVGVDPSPGMLAEAGRRLPDVRLTLGTAEQLPVADASADFLSMGYALRHVSDLSVTFREFRRALKPGGRVCVLEITRPDGRVRMAALRLYMRWVVPAFTRLAARHADSHRLWSYYWDTIERCVAPERILDAMRDAGFEDVRRHVELGIFSEYTGVAGTAHA